MSSDTLFPFAAVKDRVETIRPDVLAESLAGYTSKRISSSMTSSAVKSTL
jgi:hypothetical protein